MNPWSRPKSDGLAWLAGLLRGVSVRPRSSLHARATAAGEPTSSHEGDEKHAAAQPGGVRDETQRRTACHSVTPAGVRAAPLMVDPATRPV